MSSLKLFNGFGEVCLNFYQYYVCQTELIHLFIGHAGAGAISRHWVKGRVATILSQGYHEKTKKCLGLN